MSDNEVVVALRELAERAGKYANQAPVPETVLAPFAVDLGALVGRVAELEKQLNLARVENSHLILTVARVSGLAVDWQDKPQYQQLCETSRDIRKAISGG